MGEILEFNKGYLEECIKLYVSTFNGAPWNDKWTIETATKRLKDIIETPNFCGLIYKENNEITGVIMGNSEQGDSGKNFYLREFFVKSDTQKQGIGTRLLNELESKLKKNDVNNIYLLTAKGDSTEGYYTRRGFATSSKIVMMSRSI